MKKNYFKIAWRNLWKNKVFSAINIVGLSASIAFALLIGAFVWNELQINHHLKDSDRQYFLTSEWKDPNMGNYITTLGPIAKRLKDDYPNLVANYYRWDGITSVVSKDDKHFRENIQLGDSTLLSMYGFELVEGNAKVALTEPYSAVITTSIAIKYFGRTDVIGQSLAIRSFSGDNHGFMITGVLKDMPENSVTMLNKANHNTFFIPNNTYKYFGRADFEAWTNLFVPSYVELQHGTTAKDLAGAINQLIQKNAPGDIRQKLVIRPVKLTDYYLNQDGGAVKKMLFTLSLIALFILLMAIVNFINISISSSGNRTKEIGVRKVLGGLRSQLIVQFLAESMILVSVACVLAVIAYPFVRTQFGELVGKSVPSLISFPGKFIFIPAALIVFVSLLAGAYPAFVLSSMKAVDSLKGKLKTVKEKVWLRKSLVTFQFCVALTVLIAASVITEQVKHFFGKGLGYNKEFIVSSQVPRDWTPTGVAKMETVRNEFASIPGVIDVALSYEIPNGMNGGQPPVYKAGADSSATVPMQAMVTDEHYLSTYQISLKEGSFFDGHRLDSGKVVLNEEAARSLGYKNDIQAVGQQIRIPGDPTIFTIKGITSDFHFASMQQKIAPIIFFNVTFAPTYRYLSFKIKPDHAASTINAIQKKWAQLLSGSSFEYSYMDDTLANVYATEIQLKKAAFAATTLSLIIMLLGVLGLISLSIHKRIKEIGIRKVLGASAPGIILLFVKEFVIIIIAAAIVAIPFASVLMNNWLSNYADHISISPQPFVLAVMALAVITIILICLQTVKSALANPVRSFRTE